MAINAENEKLYNIRAALPEHPQVFERWANESALSREQLQAFSQLNVAYGPAPLQRLDLFLTDNKSAPLYVFLHGGYWQAMDKSFFSFLAPAFIKAGCSLAVVNYSLCPHVTLDEIANEVQQALMWLSQHGHQYGYDESNLHLSGHSAGGQLTAMMMSDEVAAPLLASALCLSGLFDLRPLIATSINDQLNLDFKSARQNSPLFKKPVVRIPLLLGVGEHESEGFHEQSRILAERWRHRLTDVRVLKPTGCDHLSLLEDWANPCSELFQASLALIGHSG